ncbi:MAG: hypothetical protein AB8D52_00995 [Gammaproteobacteria bacterium]
MTRLLLLLLICSTLSACSTFSIASLFTMAFTGKGFGDHALSTVTGQDCDFLNLVQGENICTNNNDSAEMVLLTSDQFIDDSIMIAQQ